ncbi:MAG: hypothetical protein J6K87_00080 [Clostridia bacterium]|nr:hypothetical protein [Clostridia bacterium]
MTKDGYILKNNNLSSVQNKTQSTVSERDLELINKLTRRKFNADEIYVFSLILCDNDIDREYERFTDNSLHKLEKLYVGKTGILDHKPSSNNQTARIFECKVESVPNRKNCINQDYKRLIAKAYMPRCSKNENIILEIDSGIKKEVSVGCSIEKMTCSICNKNIKSGDCVHIKGQKYKDQVCHVILDNPVDAYEWSFVAVPAQREAGVIKNFNNNNFNNLKGGERNMDEIKDFVNKNKNNTHEIFELIKSLKEKAEIGQVYYEELKNEVIKLSSIIQPDINLMTMKSVTEKLSIEELKSFRDSFRSRLAKMVPAKPQFNHINNLEKTESPETKNIQFQI